MAGVSSSEREFARELLGNLAKPMDGSASVPEGIRCARRTRCRRIPDAERHAGFDEKRAVHPTEVKGRKGTNRLATARFQRSRGVESVSLARPTRHPRCTPRWVVIV